MVHAALIQGNSEQDAGIFNRPLQPVPKYTFVGISKIKSFILFSFQVDVAFYSYPCIKLSLLIQLSCLLNQILLIFCPGVGLATVINRE